MSESMWKNPRDHIVAKSISYASRAETNNWELNLKNKPEELMETILLKILSKKLEAIFKLFKTYIVFKIIFRGAT